MFWHQDPTIPYFSPAYTHPDWLGASPTADWDIYWFRLRPNEDWVSFQFDYEGCLICIRYRVNHTALEVQLFVPGEDRTNYDAMEDIVEFFCCTLWFGASETRPNTPYCCKKYTVFNDVALELHGIPKESRVFGFYSGEWQESSREFSESSD